MKKAGHPHASDSASRAKPSARRNNLKELWHSRWALKAGSFLVGLFYLVAIFADFLAPYDYRAQSRREPFAPPTVIHFQDSQGRWHARPFIYAQRLADPLERRYEEERQRFYSLELFPPGDDYSLFGLFTVNRHLFGVRDAVNGERHRVCLLGTDVFGRDRLSRLLIATRFSLQVGPLGTVLAALLGILIGCVAGYSGRSERRSMGWSWRWIDDVLMRTADTMMALPDLILILAARAAFPLELPPASVAALLIGIFVTLGWAEMARLSRGLILELRERDFVMAAVSIGMPPARVLSHHILPNAARPLIAQTLLMLPAFLLSETALSFLGVGLQEPEPGWGNLLAEAADLSWLEREHAWVVLTPALAITCFVLGVRLISAGLEQQDE